MTLAFYQNLLASAAVGVFYTNLPMYLYWRQGVTIAESPKHWIISFGILSVPFLGARALGWDVQKLPILAWCFAYIGISIIWFFPSSQSEIAWQEVRNHFFSVLVLFFMLIVFSSEPAIMWARRTLVVAVVFGAGVNLYELFHPMAFSEVSGRSAGLYMNPNMAGEALVLGMILSLTALDGRYRVPFIVLVGLGILTTFSRGGIVAWCIAVFTLMVKRQVRLKHFLFSGLMGLIVVVFVLMPKWEELLKFWQDTGVMNANVEERINWFLNPSLSFDQSSWQRSYLVQQGWEKFNEHPFVGSGIGTSMEEWGGLGSHNGYLSLMMDHGIIGVTILPFLLLSLIWRASREIKQTGLVFALTALWLGFATHKLLDRVDCLLLFALLAVMVATSRWNNQDMNSEEYYCRRDASTEASLSASTHQKLMKRLPTT